MLARHAIVNLCNAGLNQRLGVHADEVGDGVVLARMVNLPALDIVVSFLYVCAEAPSWTGL